MQTSNPPTEVTAASTESELSTFSHSEQQKLREILQGLEAARAERIESGNALQALKQKASTQPNVRQPWEILPQQKWEQLNQEELLCWVQVLTESRRQNCSPLEIIETWKKLCKFDTHAHLKVDAELMNSDTLALTKVELLELASGVLSLALAMEVDDE